MDRGIVRTRRRCALRLVALHEARHGTGARGEDGALNSFRAPYTIAAQSAITHAQFHARDRGDAIVLPAHLLAVLLLHAPVRDVLVAAGNDPARIASSMREWFDANVESLAARTERPAYRTAAPARPNELVSSSGFEWVVDDAIRHVAPDKPVDSLALLIAELDRERSARSFWHQLLARPIELGPDSFLLVNGVRSTTLVMAVLERRDALGRKADTPIVDVFAREGVDVVLVNDDTTPFELVVAILRDVLMLPAEQSWYLAMTVHERGEAAVARVAPEAGADLVTRIESRARAAGFPLVATVRPAQ